MDEKSISRIIEQFDRSSLAELELKEGNFKMALRKAAAFPVAAAPLASGTPVVAAPSVAGDAPAPEKQSEGELVTAPLVGTFYASPAPDAPAFVSEGDTVKKGDPLCILEAMKMMNKLDAEFDCKIIKVLASNQSMVEYGTPLFEVEPL